MMHIQKDDLGGIQQVMYRIIFDKKKVNMNFLQNVDSCRCVAFHVKNGPKKNLLCMEELYGSRRRVQVK